MQTERDAVVPKKLERKRERQSVVAPHTNARAEGRRERKSAQF